jgi:hypothetical protein
MAALNDLQEKFDARALAAGCMSKSSFLYSNLRRMGYETPESLAEIYGFGMEAALDDKTPAAKVQTEQGHILDLNAKPN